MYSGSQLLVDTGLANGREVSRFPLDVQFTALKHNIRGIERHLAQSVRNHQPVRTRRLATLLANQMAILEELTRKIQLRDDAASIPIDAVDTWKGHVVRPDLTVNYNEMVRKFGPKQQRHGIAYVNHGMLVEPKRAVPPEETDSLQQRMGRRGVGVIRFV